MRVTSWCLWGFKGVKKFHWGVTNDSDTLQKGVSSSLVPEAEPGPEAHVPHGRGVDVVHGGKQVDPRVGWESQKCESVRRVWPMMTTAGRWDLGHPCKI